MNLIFVYNAKSGFMNSSFDAIHKIVSPKTYNCRLCKLTHGALSEKREWINFVKKSKHTFEFFNKDEFEERFQHKFSYPCVLSYSESILGIVIDNIKMNSLNNIGDLINEIKIITKKGK